MTAVVYGTGVPNVYLDAITLINALPSRLAAARGATSVAQQAKAISISTTTLANLGNTSSATTVLKVLAYLAKQ